MSCGRRGFFFGSGCGRGLGPGCLVYLIGVVVTAILIISII
ncbi:MAG TPA: hypothetical protein VEG39_20170 [Clostridia bacterium]|nr:hypothetical protein [Clostridia bacterium]